MQAPGVLAATVWFIVTVAWPVDGAVGWWNCTEHFVNGVPPSQLNNTISLCRGGYYALSWDPPMENPSWAAYRISKQNTSMNIPGRINGFRKDPDLQDLGVPNPSSNDEAYNALWNRGHVAPSAILSATYLSKYETYYTSNIAPQWGQFNQGSWASLESRVFKFIDTTNRTLHIVTGVGYANRSTAVKVGDVALPTWYWKALCDVDAKTSVAFIGNNSQDGGGMMWTYRSVQDVQDTVFCGTQDGPGLNDTALNAAGGRGGFSIFPVDICNTQTYNSSHWNFDDYRDHNLQGANCSFSFQHHESSSGTASSALGSSTTSVGGSSNSETQSSSAAMPNSRSASSRHATGSSSSATGSNETNTSSSSSGMSSSEVSINPPIAGDSASKSSNSSASDASSWRSHTGPDSNITKAPTVDPNAGHDCSETRCCHTMYRERNTTTACFLVLEAQSNSERIEVSVTLPAWPYADDTFKIVLVQPTPQSTGNSSDRAGTECYTFRSTEDTLCIHAVFTPSQQILTATWTPAGSRNGATAGSSSTSPRHDLYQEPIFLCTLTLPAPPVKLDRGRWPVVVAIVLVACITTGLVIAVTVIANRRSQAAGWRKTRVGIWGTNTSSVGSDSPQVTSLAAVMNGEEMSATMNDEVPDSSVGGPPPSFSLDPGSALKAKMWGPDGVKEVDANEGSEAAMLVDDDGLESHGSPLVRDHTTSVSPRVANLQRLSRDEGPHQA